MNLSFISDGLEPVREGKSDEINWMKLKEVTDKYCVRKKVGGIEAMSFLIAQSVQ